MKVPVIGDVANLYNPVNEIEKIEDLIETQEKLNEAPQKPVEA